MAARSALRSIPALKVGEESTTLSVFRAVCAGWVAANNPKWRDNPDLSRAIFAANVFSHRVGTGTPPNAVGVVSRAILTATSIPKSARTSAAASAIAASASVVVAVADRVGRNDVWRVVADDARILEHPIQLRCCDHPLAYRAPNW
jgi:hypothetical protein